MKKYLLTGLLTILTAVPVMAETEISIDVTGLLEANHNDYPCSGAAFEVDGDDVVVTMQANFVPNCTAGNYLKVVDTLPEGAPDYPSINDGGYAYCTPCEPGSYCEGINEVALVSGTGENEGKKFLETQGVTGTCGTGTYSTAGASECTSCNSGTYQDEQGQSSCKSCTAGHYCPEKSSSEIICPVGNYCVAGIGAPTECGVGTYNPTAGAQQAEYDSDNPELGGCRVCEVNTYNSATGQSSCESCPTSWPTTGEATGSNIITACYSTRPTTPNCVNNIKTTNGNCTLVGDAEQQGYGYYWESTFEQCAPGYDKTKLSDLGQVVLGTLAGIDNGSGFSLSLSAATPLTAVKGGFVCREDNNTWACGAVVHTLIEGASNTAMTSGNFVSLHSGYDSVTACQEECLFNVTDVTDGLTATAVWNSITVDKDIYVCKAKPISVTWYGKDNNTTILTNNCTYGELGLTTPQQEPAEQPEACSAESDPNANGCTFLGWTVQQ